MNITAIKDTVISTAKMTGLKIQKYSPEIMVGTGIVFTIVGVGLACKATLELEDILDEGKVKENKIKAVFNGDPVYNENGEEINYNKDLYTEKKYNKDLLIVKSQTAFKIGRAYSPAVACEIIGISLLLGSHHIMTKRNAAAIALYKASEQSFFEYRDRVKAKFGEETEDRIFRGVELEEITETVKDEETGRKKKVKTEVEKQTGNHLSPYAFIFDESSCQWSKSPSQNKFFVEVVQNHLNDKLRDRGHLFLNDVREAFGFDPIPMGQIVGWIYDPVHGKDNYVDFGLSNVMNESKRDFVNCYERSVWIDPNVDGVIYDLI